MTRRSLPFALLIAGLLVTQSLLAGTIVIVNKDAPGVGFNDPTPAAPVGGNNGKTLGEQRLNVFSAAAEVWGAKLKSRVTIKIAAYFIPMTPCGATSGVLGAAGPTLASKDFPNAPKPNTLYPVALASALSGTDLAAINGAPDGAAIEAQFNSSVGTATCFPASGWYLGLDGNFGSKIDLMAVLLHEFAHGLGFIGFVDLDTGAMSIPDVFSTLTFDDSTSMRWSDMTDAQRAASATNTGHVVFDGSNVTAGASILTAGKNALGHPNLYVPSPVQIGTSIYHYDTTAAPNQLMEPNMDTGVTHEVDLPKDLAAQTMLDLGWQLCSPISVDQTALPSGGITTAYSHTITASGGTPAYSFSISSGSLPPGITLLPTGTLAGTPTSGGTFNFTIAASDSVGCTGFRTYTLAISGGCTAGDANGDAQVTVGDVFFLINYLFASGPAPMGTAPRMSGLQGTISSCTIAGDSNGDSAVTVGDVFYLINHLFMSGPAPLSIGRKSSTQ